MSKFSCFLKKVEEKKIYLFSFNKFIYLQVIFLALLFYGCCGYSFTGSNAPEHIKSIAIPIADDRSGSGEANLREYLTNTLVQKFIQDNTLQVTERANANSVLECIVTSISDIPGVIQAGEVVSKRKVTITVNVVYKDLVKRKVVYEKAFSNFSNYPEGADINQRRAAINEAIDKITDDILLDTVSGW